MYTQLAQHIAGTVYPITKTPILETLTVGRPLYLHLDGRPLGRPLVNLSNSHHSWAR